MAHRKHPRLPVDQRLKIARADAIEAYSNLEIALCRLLALLLGTKVDLAGIVFFRINNTRARSAALDSLLRVCPETSSRIAEFSEHEAD